MQNRQSDSHRVTNYKLFLDELFNNPGNTFTDTEMLKKLPVKSLNTIRKIRIDLQNNGAIKLHENNLPNNEKKYKMCNKHILSKLLREYHVLYQQKIESNIISEDNITYFKKFAPFILVKYTQPSTKPEHKYPKKFYNRGLCPVCQGKLHGFKSGKFNLDDYKCSKCKFTFYSGAYVLASKKPIKNKKALNYAPWNSYDNSAMQRASDKIQRKILRDDYRADIIRRKDW